jgi:hypothetical protein
MVSVPHDRSPNRRGSLSDRALRPWLEAAVLLILLFCGAFYSLRQTTVQSNAARSWVKRPAICCDSKAVLSGAPTTIAW